jgi:serine/threonine protein kinase
MGEVFAGRYELVDPIGRGGVGAVWRAWDHRRRAYVAAKVLRQGDAHSLLRFVREQSVRIDHPHVLAPRSWAADDEQVLFTMELVGGGSLAHLIGDYGPLPPAYVCVLLDQLLSGLSAVHEEDVVHRDVKPANILLESTGVGQPHLRLSDFGVAMRKGEPRLTRADHVVGTPGYFAPEQLLGAEPDFPADLYAAGLVALFLLTGRKPDARALVERFTASGGRPVAPQGIPDPLWEVVATLLQPSPQARFRTATGARKALARAAELLPVPGFDDEPIEVFDQLGPLPAGFGPDGPLHSPPRPAGTATPLTPPPHTAAPPARTAAPPTPRTAVPLPPAVPPAPQAPPPSPVPAAPPAARGLPTAVGSATETDGFRLAPPRPAAGPQPATPSADTPSAPTPREPGPRAAERRRRARPPLGVVVGMYLAAAACLVFGLWALAGS